ncbi:MAG: histidine--tRNA ligase [Dehalococcoidales bacterium]|nr:histidine--tRNA ligase [Dehalococcoidales bacterium]
MYSAPRGVPDILPEDQVYWHYVGQKAAHICQLYGYERIDLPVFEDTRVFVKGTGDTTDIVQKEMYTFEDRGGNSVTLKPEGTPSVCRAYLEHGMQNLPQPVKLFYISPIFRYDRPQAGRYRQHYQFGCEAIGEADAFLDAEVIDMAWRFMKSLGLRKILLYINSIGCPQCRPDYLGKLRSYYKGHVNDLCPDCKIRLEKNVLRLLDCKQPGCQKIVAAAPRNVDYLCPDCTEHFAKLKEYLKMLDIPFEVNSYLVRGLDYYTRTVFEIQSEEEKAQNALGGGGRYDGLIETLGGKPTPGIGFALGIDRIILNLKKEAVDVPPIPAPQVFIASLGEPARNEAMKLAAALRQKGIGVISATSAKSLKAQLRQANNLKISKTVIIGDDEVKAGTAVLRDMFTSQQSTVKLSELPKLLK